MPENIFLESQDEQLEKVLDAVDLRTNAQTQLHSALMDGFISLARERYRDSLATYRKFYLKVYDCTHTHLPC